MSSESKVTRRRFLQTSAMLAAGGVLVACAPAAAPAAQTGDAESGAGGEIIELTYMTPDRELENRVKEVQIERFNAKMEEEGKPWRVVDVRGPATDNDIKTKLTLDAAAGNLPDIFRVRARADRRLSAAGYLGRSCSTTLRTGKIGTNIPTC